MDRFSKMTPFCCLLGLRVHVQYRLNGNRRAERRRRRSQPAADGDGPVEVELSSVAVDTTVVGRRSRQQFVSFVSFRFVLQVLQVLLFMFPRCGQPMHFQFYATDRWIDRLSKQIYVLQYCQYFWFQSERTTFLAWGRRRFKKMSRYYI